MTTALLAPTADPYLSPARVYVRARRPDGEVTVAQVEDGAVALAADAGWRAAVDEARRDADREAQRLRDENRRLRNHIAGARQTILAARNVGKPGHSAFALGCVLLALPDLGDEHQH